MSLKCICTFFLPCLALSELNPSNSNSLFFSCVTETWILSPMFPKYTLKLSQVKVTKREMMCFSILPKETLGCSLLTHSPRPFCGAHCCQPLSALHRPPPPPPSPHLPARVHSQPASPSAALLYTISARDLPTKRCLSLSCTFCFQS